MADPFRRRGAACPHDRDIGIVTAFRQDRKVGRRGNRGGTRGARLDSTPWRECGQSPPPPIRLESIRLVMDREVGRDNLDRRDPPDDVGGAGGGAAPQRFQPRRPDHERRSRRRLGLPQRQPRRLRLGRLQPGPPAREQPDSRLLFPPLPCHARRPDVLPDLLQPLHHPRPAVHPQHELGGDHPAGFSPTAPATMPIHPYNDTLGTQVLRPQPNFNGRVEAPAINPGTSGLRP